MAKTISNPVRYALVGLGWISQEVVLPGFGNAKNSQLAALVTGDHTKARDLGATYKISECVGYDDYDRLMQSGNIDAVYIGLPNSMHKDFAIRAAQAGVHVLCEKPMAGSVAECEAMIRAAEENDVRLMIAYRLHFEPGNLKAIQAIKDGEIGEPRIFNSVFTQQIAEGNVRLKKSLDGGPLMDMGVYPINACRYLFQDEPIEVIGAGIKGDDPRFTEVHEGVTGILRFAGDRLGVFTCSFGAAAADAYQVVGTKGELWMKPAYDYHNELTLITKIDGKEKQTPFKKTDQFGAEIEYFSDCLLNNGEPEPSGYEGLADLRIVDALLQSMRSGRPVPLEPFHRTHRPQQDQAIVKSPVKPGKIVKAHAPG